MFGSPTMELQDTLKLLLEEGLLDCLSRQGNNREAGPVVEGGSPTRLDHCRMEWELSASVAVMRAGLDIDCLMMRYQVGGPNGRAGGETGGRWYRFDLICFIKRSQVQWIDYLTDLGAAVPGGGLAGHGQLGVQCRSTPPGGVCL